MQHLRFAEDLVAPPTVTAPQRREADLGFAVLNRVEPFPQARRRRELLSVDDLGQDARGSL